MEPKTKPARAQILQNWIREPGDSSNLMEPETKSQGTAQRSYPERHSVLMLCDDGKPYSRDDSFSLSIGTILLTGGEGGRGAQTRSCNTRKRFGSLGHFWSACLPPIVDASQNTWGSPPIVTLHSSAVVLGLHAFLNSLIFLPSYQHEQTQKSSRFHEVW